MNRSSRFLPALVTLALVAVAACGSGAPEAPRVLATLDIKPTPTPAPTPKGAGQLALEAFVKRVAGGSLTYHASFKGNMVAANGGVTIVGALDVAGRDYQTSFSFAFAKQPKVVVGVRSVGATKWMRVAGGRWATATDRSATTSNSPFAGIAGVNDVRLLSTVKVSGKNRHHLEFAGGEVIGPEQITPSNLTDERVEWTRMELVVDDAGTPLSATWRLEGTGRVDVQLQGLRFDLTLAFSKVGAKMIIKAP
ncbi:MAG: hypothetical protein M3067_10240 [Chloroflexota bacterium]|nr:hypothetical protein [Chloroflexota bacterium]